MVNIKRFIDRVSTMDSRSGRDLVMPALEARALRDEIVKLLLDKTQEQLNKQPETIEVQVSGGRW
jgi:hypothetical protein